MQNQTEHKHLIRTESFLIKGEGEVTITIGEKIENSLIIHKKKWTCLLIIIIIFLDVSIGLWVYNNSGYPSKAKVYLDENEFRSDYHELPQNFMVTVALTFHCDGPISGENDLNPYELRIMAPYADDYNISLIKFFFILRDIDKVDSSDDGIVIQIPINNSSHLKDFTQPLSSEEHNKFRVSSGGTKKVEGWIKIMIDGEEYFSGWSDNTYDTIEFEPAEKYQQYRNNRLSVTALVIAAISFSFPATVKVLRDLYWGKEKD